MVSVVSVCCCVVVVLWRLMCCCYVWRVIILGIGVASVVIGVHSVMVVFVFGGRVVYVL